MSKKIIHKGFKRINNLPYYLCNQAIGVANLTKISIDWKKVNCKNCLKKRR